MSATSPAAGHEFPTAPFPSRVSTAVNTMQAITQKAYGEGDVFRFESVTRPQPGRGQVLVRVQAAGVSQADWHLTTGRPWLMRIMGFGLRRPKNRIPGTDLAGRVEAIGDGVTEFAVGDEVFGVTTGAWAEYALVDETQLAPRPKGLDPERAAASIDSALTALEAVRDVAKVKAGQSVLVIGASGGVGSFAVQIARALGAEVIGVASAAKANFVRSLGARRVIDYRTQEITDDGQRYDVVLDIAGNRPLSVLRRVLKPKGTLVIVGGEGGGALFGGVDRQLRALMLSPFVGPRLTTFVSASRTRVELEAITQLIERGAVEPKVDKVRPIAEAGDALADMREGRVQGKIVLRI